MKPEEILTYCLKHMEGNLRKENEGQAAWIG